MHTHTHTILPKQIYAQTIPFVFIVKIATLAFSFCFFLLASSRLGLILHGEAEKSVNNDLFVEYTATFEWVT